MNINALITAMIFLSGLFCTNYSTAQSLISPGAEQNVRMEIYAGTIHVGDGSAIENGVVVFEKGLLIYVGERDGYEGESGAEVIRTAGMVYPGFIAPNTTLGLSEISAMRATRDFKEIGQFNSSIRALIAYNTDSDVIPTVRSNGVLMTQIVPQGGLMSGMSSVVHLDGWNWEDAVIKMDEGMHLRWPNKYTRKGGRGNRFFDSNKSYDDQINKIERFFKDGQAYCEGLEDGKKENLKLEAMCEVYSGHRTLYIHASWAKEIMEAVLFAHDFGLEPVVVGGEESYLITDFLKAHRVPIVLEKTQRLPSREDSDIDQPFKTPRILEESGVLYCIAFSNYWNCRNLPFQAGQAVNYGLKYEDAVRAITSNAAQILGIDERIGSLAVGKEATLIISEGDALDMRTCKISHAFIQGRKINLDNKQEALYRKFKAKYGD